MTRLHRWGQTALRARAPAAARTKRQVEVALRLAELALGATTSGRLGEVLGYGSALSARPGRAASGGNDAINVIGFAALG
jgi:hypothetical protein